MQRLHRNPTSKTLARRLVAAVLAFVLGAGPARAGDDVPEPPDLSGTYSSSGTMAGGTEYTGTVVLKKKLSVRWRKGGPRFNSYDATMDYSIGWSGKGVATFIDGRLYIAAGKDRKYLGLSVKRPVSLSPEIVSLRLQYMEAKRKNRESGYKKSITVKGDPWWTDVWWHGHYGVVFRADGKWAVETVGRIDDGRDCPPLGEGRWTCVRTYYKDNGEENALDYTSGEFELEKVGDAWRASYFYWDKDTRKVGEANPGAAFMPDARTVVNVLNGDGSEYIGAYEIQGRAFVGKTCNTSDLSISTENLTVPDDVAAKNPGLFR